MNEDLERKLRPLVLILITAICIVGVLSVLFIPGLSPVTIVTIVVGIIGLLFTIYREYSEPAKIIDSAIDPEQISNHNTVGVQDSASLPDISEEEFEIAKMDPEDLASMIMNGSNWRPDGHGNYSTWWRPKLRGLFWSERFSVRVFEIGMIVLSSVSISVLFLRFFAVLEGQLSNQFLSGIAGLYPLGISNSAETILLFIAGLGVMTGPAYFLIKDSSTCPECENPFSLRSCKRHYKLDNTAIDIKLVDDEEQAYEIRWGVHIFCCDDCGSWILLNDEWEVKRSDRVVNRHHS